MGYKKNRKFEGFRAAQEASRGIPKGTPKAAPHEASHEVPDGRREGDLVSGIFQATPRRGGFVVPDKAGLPDIRIAPSSTGTALHGDHVQVSPSRARLGQQPNGRITRVLRHANHQIVGRLVRTGRGCIVQPKNRRIDRIIEIHRQFDPKEVPEGAWVIVEIRQWSSGPEEPLVGRLAEVLGTEEQAGLPILLLIREGGITPDFPPEVVAETEPFRDHAIQHHDLRGRLDFRKAQVITIDPATAKDFDDAVSLIEIREDGWRIGVHIADVAHYVKPGSRIDAEAFERATSIYPVDRVIPMLPEVLSNQVCSLRPGEDRLTMSAIFTVSATGAVSDVELCSSVIRSARRFAYEEVQGIFDEADEALGLHPSQPRTPHPRPVIPEELWADLTEIRKAGRALAAARLRRGSLDLDLPETEILFDSSGRVSDVRRAQRFESHRLIEELMIAANESVARELERHHLPTLFRVHDEPNEDKLRTIAPALARLGIPVPIKGGISRAQLQQALHAAHKHPAGAVVQRWVLRAMMRAKYQPENIGHFGLASKHYLHFTSPIRRYPDLVVHRVVKALLAGVGPEDPELIQLQDNLPAWGRHTSQREERAQKIEWKAQEILSLDFMRRYMGDVFEGFVSGVSPMGFFVELRDYPVEGLVRISQFDDDFYDLDDDYHIWRGRSSGRTFALGDPMTVLIERIDVLAGQMDLIMLRKQGQPKSAKKKTAPRFRTSGGRGTSRGRR